MPLLHPDQHSGYDVEAFIGPPVLDAILKAAYWAMVDERSSIINLGLLLTHDPAVLDPLDRLVIREPSVAKLAVIDSGTANLVIDLPIELRNFDPVPGADKIAGIPYHDIVDAPDLPPFLRMKRQSPVNTAAREASASQVRDQFKPGTVTRPPRRKRQTLRCSLKLSLADGQRNLQISAGHGLFDDVATTWLKSEGKALSGVPLNEFLAATLPGQFSRVVPLPAGLAGAMFLKGTDFAEACLGLGLNLPLLLQDCPIAPADEPADLDRYSIQLLYPDVDPTTLAKQLADDPDLPTVDFRLVLDRHDTSGKVVPPVPIPAMGLSLIYAQTPLAARFPLGQYTPITGHAGGSSIRLRDDRTNQPVSALLVASCIRNWRARGRQDRLVNQYSRIDAAAGHGLIIRMHDQTLVRLKQTVWNMLRPTVNGDTRSIPGLGDDVSARFTEVILGYIGTGLGGRILGKATVSTEAVGITWEVDADLTAYWRLDIPVGPMDHPPALRITGVDIEGTGVVGNLAEVVAPNLINSFERNARLTGQGIIDSQILGLGLDALPRSMDVQETRHADPVLRGMHQAIFSTTSIEVAGPRSRNLLIAWKARSSMRPVADAQGRLVGLVLAAPKDGVSILTGVVWRNRHGVDTTLRLDAMARYQGNGTTAPALLKATPLRITLVHRTAGSAVAVSAATPDGPVLHLTADHVHVLQQWRLIDLPGVSTVDGHRLVISGTVDPAIQKSAAAKP